MRDGGRSMEFPKEKDPIVNTAWPKVEKKVTKVKKGVKSVEKEEEKRLKNVKYDKTRRFKDLFREIETIV